MGKWILLFCLLASVSPLYAAQPQPAGSTDLTSVVGKKWPGARFRVDFDEAQILADPTMVITIAFLISPDNKTFRTIAVSHIHGGVKISTNGTYDTILNFPVPPGYYARLTVTHNKALVFNMSMGAK